jgi:1-acyl-sn-glycerol-3-phosphate acyltransferase
VEPVYSTVIAIARTMFRVQGLKFRLTGTENVPRSGGALVVMNHIGFFDFTYAGFAAKPRGRYVRFMAKAEVFAHPVGGPLMRGMHHIPVDRAAGAGAFDVAVQALRDGEVVGVFPEATISSSFELKAFKSGAARMALEAGVPILPMVIWGSQRVWTKRAPKHLGRTGTPISVDIGAPIEATGSALELTNLVKDRMQTQLDRVRADYPDGHPAGAPWVPASMGGSAPTPDEVVTLDRADTRGKVAARRAKMDGRKHG